MLEKGIQPMHAGKTLCCWQPLCHSRCANTCGGHLLGLYLYWEEYI